MLKNSCDLTGLHFDDIWAGTRSVPSPFLIFAALFLVSTRPYSLVALLVAALLSD